MVWKSFEKFVDANIGPDQVGVLIAWNGEGCDLRWLYKVAQAPYSSLNFPCKVKYFLDPLAVLRTYSRCKLNRKHSKLESYSLGSVYEYITGNVLDEAHDSLVDVKAQTFIVKDSRFIPFINCTQSIRTIDEMFQRREQRDILKKSEPSREVHKPWVELREGSSFRWEPPRRNSYNGHNSGGRHGPSNAIKRTALREVGKQNKNNRPRKFLSRVL